MIKQAYDESEYIENVGPSREEMYRQRALEYKIRFETEMEEEDPEYLQSEAYKKSEEKQRIESENYIKNYLRN
jgi:hypothetical protein